MDGIRTACHSANIMRIKPTTALLVSLGALLFGASASAEPVSAALAAQRLREGAQAWDVRSEGQALLPGAVRLAADGLQDARSLARAVSAAGIDLSRDVLIYGEPGDVRAQALHALAGRLASGRVDWLVGGLAEWQMSGHSVVVAPAQRLPVPQRLVAWDDIGESGGAARMAAAARRDLPAIEPPQQMATR